jgi:hypothetical protein
MSTLPATTANRPSRRWRRVWPVGLSVLGLAVLVVIGARSGPADPVQPLTLQEQDRVASLDDHAP